MYESLIQDLAQPTILCATPQMKLFDQKTGDWHVYRIDEESGIFVASFRPSELGGEGLFIEAEDGWSVRITPEEEQYRLRLFTPGSRLVDDSCVFDADQDFNPI
jgi:hypothetical protein